MDIKNGKNLSAEELVSYIETQPVNLFLSLHQKKTETFATLIAAPAVLFVLWKTQAYQAEAFTAALSIIGAIWWSIIWVLLIKKILSPPCYYTLSSKAIISHRFSKSHTTPWSKVKSAQTYGNPKCPTLGIFLQNNDLLYSQLSGFGLFFAKFKEFFSYPALSLPQARLGGIKADTLAKVILHFSELNDKKNPLTP